MGHLPFSDPAPVSVSRWAEFERLFGDRARSSDAAWATNLRPAERVALVEDLFATIRGVHEANGDWADIDAAAWRETLEERVRFVTAFGNYREAGADGRRGVVADAG
jgi:hypothetical protein